MCLKVSHPIIDFKEKNTTSLEAMSLSGVEKVSHEPE